MSFYMIDHLLETIPWEWFKWNSVWGWFPFKVEKLLLMCFLPGEKILLLENSITIRRVLCRLPLTYFILILRYLWIFDSESTFHYLPNKPWIISIVNDELQMFIFARLVAICRKFCVLSVCIFTCLYELFFLFFEDFIHIDRFFRRKFTQKFAK